ncbi:undecaprenyldiphospho-muramoylpentapeptide beta-N-acetylglucosaminyltransferase [Maritalea mediterranea]|uniref:UDP-N-acetylglucosamine--N-acetylmuramyl-(pentapeptide) pyrophosphoryl-undecaprenol N-acetylglucosamine transferase n=1 Tax=Maritalea mediterranea TaxID=2909667 RepID=A0ABS9E7S7_9HYPH|nr:undecaprenyldiphospho-muramoylpentapeptide beta-N-acetylglucosaminyltransferase [Maritalea mediterranea]MCF4098929.1 undecaprenyldiphospho-muramoylpentapeptide beta-N-acetylglucosaminyltransferase [Maritalea mediterranea]
MSKFVMVAGGTGGHLFPAQALAEELLRRGHTVYLMTDARAKNYGGDFPALETIIVPAATPSFRHPFKAIKAGFTILAGVRKARKALKRIKPDAIVGFGGYPTFPPFLAASMLGIPGVLHEANSVLGRANRALVRFCEKLALGFEDTKYAERFSDKTVITGNPVRDMVHQVANIPYPPLGAEHDVRITVFGGSQGAQIFSQVLPGAIAALPDELRARLKLVQQCREEDLQRMAEVYAQTRVNVDAAPFFKDLPRLMAKSHLVICRAGALTVSELGAIGRPAIYVPLPGSLDQDQLNNAKRMEAAGGGVVMEQAALSPHSLATKITELLAHPAQLQQMATNAKNVGMPDAVQRLADLTEQTAKAG